jgi:hypothetical protein
MLLRTVWAGVVSIIIYNIYSSTPNLHKMSAKTGDQQFVSDRIVAFQMVQFLQAFKEKNESAGESIDSACQVQYIYPMSIYV